MMAGGDQTGDIRFFVTPRKVLRTVEETAPLPPLKPAADLESVFVNPAKCKNLEGCQTEFKKLCSASPSRFGIDRITDLTSSIANISNPFVGHHVECSVKAGVYTYGAVVNYCSPSSYKCIVVKGENPCDFIVGGSEVLWGFFRKLFGVVVCNKP